MRTITVGWLVERSGAVLVAVLLATALLALPMVLLAPDSEASQNPSGEVFDAQGLIDDRFVSSVFSPFFIVEARGGDMLRREPLLELLENERGLRQDPSLGLLLFSYESAKFGATVTGVYTIADAIDEWLRGSGVEGGLAAASDDQVKLAASELLQAGASTAELGDQFSPGSKIERRLVAGREIDYWTVPAFGVVVLADNAALGGGSFAVSLGGDESTLRKEEFSRDVQALLRGSQRAYRVWGVAIDVNLTSREQGATAGPFIMFTIVAVLLVVGMTFRSYWAVALVGGSLAALMVWLRGIGNLIGLENSLIMTFIVPIAMISFGVDFAFHAIGRYRQELATRRPPRAAYVAGLAGVSGALSLALLSDSLAFLSNVTSGIPAVIQFGIGASVALAAAFMILGVVTPLALMRIEERVGKAPRRRTHVQRLARVLATVTVAVVAGLVVLFIIFFPMIGVVALPLYLLAFIVAPLAWSSRRSDVESDVVSAPDGHGGGWPLMGAMTHALGRARYAVLPAAVVVTALAVLLATRVEASFDVKDFFAADSGFVVGLDKLDEHSAGGEPALVYVEGSLTDVRSLRAIAGLIDAIDASQSGRFGRLASGELQVRRGVLDVLRESIGSPAALAAIARSTGVAVTDADGDGIPDSPTQIAAVYRFAQEAGVPGTGGLILTPDDVAESLWMSADGARQATVLTFGLVGTREQENVVAAREEFQPLVAELETALRQSDPGAMATLTGSPVTRQAGLDATTRALQRSLPLAVALCLVVLIIFMRSIRYALVTIVPILLVVAWLYAFMAVAGFRLNLVTGTIGAISIGVGIDYAVHFTMRFREELESIGDRFQALRAAGTGTGSALLASAASSMIGFAIMALAPMPMFATFGLLTAVMIAFAVAATLLVLPALLVIITRERIGAPSTTA